MSSTADRERLMQVLLGPHVSEKATSVAESGNQVVFKVRNDATKTDGRVCKRVNGVVPEIGTTCVGGTSCKNAFQFSATFGAYGVDITN